MMPRFLGMLAGSLSAKRRVRLECIGALVLVLCLAACAGGGTGSTGQATSSASGLPTATSQPFSSTSTPQASSTTSPHSTATATATGQTALTCSNLKSFYQAITGKTGEVTITMSISTTTAIHGQLKAYTSQPESTMTGTGYIVAPNDMVNLTVTQGSNSISVSVNDTVKGTNTTYSVSKCSAPSTTEVILTGTSPASFTADILERIFSK
jgi:hypothetical protein